MQYIHACNRSWLITPLQCIIFIVIIAVKWLLNFWCCKLLTLFYQHVFFIVINSLGLYIYLWVFLFVRKIEKLKSGFYQLQPRAKEVANQQPCGQFIEMFSFLLLTIYRLSKVIYRSKRKLVPDIIFFIWYTNCSHLLCELLNEVLLLDLIYW